MTCPNCGNLVTGEPLVNNLLICSSCLRSLVVDGEAVRFAVAADTQALSDSELAALRKARARARKALA